MLRPPVQQAAAVGMPAAYRVEPLEDALPGRLTTGGFSANAPAAGEQGEEQDDNPSMIFMKSFLLFVARKSLWLG
jgi:hypothetical protein